MQFSNSVNSTNKTTGVFDNLLSFLFTPLTSSGTQNQTSDESDEFDDFFDSIDDDQEPPTLLWILS